MGRRALYACLLVVLVAAGCGGAESTFYAGMDEGEAPQVAMDGIGREVRAAGGPLHGHLVRLGAVVRGRTGDGAEAWVVRVRDVTAERPVCVRVWAHGALHIRTYESELDFCEEAPSGGTTEAA